VRPVLKGIEEVRVVWRTRLFRRAYALGLRRMVTETGAVIYHVPAGNPAMSHDDIGALVAGVSNAAERRQIQEQLNKNRNFLMQA